MKVKVIAKPDLVCRLTESLCVKDKPVDVELNSMVRRRLRDGSLIKADDKKSSATKKVTKKVTAGEA